MAKYRMFVAIGLFCAACRPALGADESQTMRMATRMLEEIASNPGASVPVGLLRQSEGVILVPNLLNAGFVFGAKIGKGVFIVRDSRGRWGNPVAVVVSGGSFGLQIGAQSTEALMVFRNKSTVARLLAGKSKITLGVDAGAAAGPVGTSYGAETDLGMRAEILTYAKSRGLFAGAVLGGAGINVDRHATSFFYNAFGSSTFQIIEGDGVSAPPEAARLKSVLTMLTNPPKPAESDSEIEGDRRPSEPRISSSTRESRRPTTRKPVDPNADLDEPAPRRTTRRPPPDDLDLDPIDTTSKKALRPIRSALPPDETELKSARSKPSSSPSVNTDRPEF